MFSGAACKDESCGGDVFSGGAFKDKPCREDAFSRGAFSIYKSCRKDLFNRVLSRTNHAGMMLVHCSFGFI